MPQTLAVEVTRWIDHRPLAIVEPRSGDGTRWGKMALLATLDPAAGIAPLCSFMFASISRQDIGALIRLVGGESQPREGALRLHD